MQDRPYRSLLFVPAVKPDWMRKAAAGPADALVLDLEDAVPEAEKAAARANAGEAIGALAESGKGVFVRVNCHSSPHWADDLAAVVRPGLTGIALPKVYGPDEVLAVAERLAELEASAGVEAGSVDLQLLLETALGIREAFPILRSSPRVRSYFCGSARDGDANREIGFRWSPGGRETVHYRAMALLDGRAAGVPYPISGTWVDVGAAAQEGLRAFARENRDLGYTGMYVIHPSHAEIVNDEFTPSAEEVERYRAIIDEFARAEAEGLGATTVGGSMVDLAMVSRAEEFLRVAEELGVTAPDGGGERR